jgi:hypothetical protein
MTELQRAELHLTLLIKRRRALSDRLTECEPGSAEERALQLAWEQAVAESDAQVEEVFKLRRPIADVIPLCRFK